MKPSIGRIVHFVVNANYEEKKNFVIPAIITRVWSDTCVNLRLFPDDEHVGGNGEYLTSITLDETEKPAERTWHWPPKVV